MMNSPPKQLRHELHKYPELSLQEFKTTKLIISSVKALPGSEELIIHTPFTTGVLFEYKVNGALFILFQKSIKVKYLCEINIELFLVYCIYK